MTCSRRCGPHSLLVKRPTSFLVIRVLPLYVLTARDRIIEFAVTRRSVWGVRFTFAGPRCWRPLVTLSSNRSLALFSRPRSLGLWLHFRLHILEIARCHRDARLISQRNQSGLQVSRLVFCWQFFRQLQYGAQPVPLRRHASSPLKSEPRRS